MKNGMLLKLVCVMVLAVMSLSFTTSMTAHASAETEPPVVTDSNDSEDGEMSIMADVIVVKYRTFYGVEQYRRWNETRGYWVDSTWLNI